jgi:predicted alpha-1,2-mannosidase
MSKGIMSKAGYEHETYLGGGLDHYIKNGYVPHPIPEGKYGFHQDGASLTLEYAYQDWTLAQFAKALGKDDDYNYFLERSDNYKNVYDAESGWMRPKNIQGQWKDPFDPYQYENGFNESNGAQSTWFVGHDIKSLGELMGGAEKAVEKLNEQFEKASKINFTPGNSHERGEDPTRARIPINYGNQPSIQTAFIFNELGRPDLTQYWSSEVAKKTFGGLSPQTGYSGDEDQGLMGSLAVLIKMGIFQLNGGTEANPRYEFGSPLFSEVNVNLQNGKSLKFQRVGEGVYIDSASFNGKKLENFYISHDELNTGGELIFEMINMP